ncbi:hypothetical protein [Enterococcus casseliflavus]|uniref:hypothetical protein n=1 Tax=Enterococcus casseliflavus TaxID=37734 RepID=UPI00232E2213|nr:hypothetical protein [Enterococcus casseliflavus]MDB1690147.1 hypothetical protein [Enterococcus casseliflavus]
MRNFILSGFIVLSILATGILSTQSTVYGTKIIEGISTKISYGPEIGPDGENLFPGGGSGIPETDTTVPNPSLNTYPKASDGNRLRYNTPYYLKDKNLPNRGGITYRSWLKYDYAIFADSTNSRGTPIVFEHPSGRSGFIDSNDEIIVKSTGSNWNGWVYWRYTDSWNAESVWFSNQSRVFGNIYGSTTDNSVGMSMLGLRLLEGYPIPAYFFAEFHGRTTGTPWMTARSYYLPLNQNPPVPPPVENRMTPFILEEI